MVLYGFASLRLPTICRNYLAVKEIIKEYLREFLNSFNTENEAKSYISYLNTRLVRFLVFIACCGQHLNNDYTWRFVPDPGTFDHIFTDQELYQKYGLTPDEIAIIESVIKERK